MKKFVRDIVMFLLLAFPVYLLLIFLYGRFVPEKLLTTNLVSRKVNTGFTGKRLEDARLTRNVEVLFVGSSHCNRGFDTRAFADSGIQVFNLGSSSQTPSQSYTLLRHFIPRMKPRLVVFEMFPLCFTMDGVESSVDYISNGFFTPDLIEPILHQNNMKVYNTLAFSSIAGALGFQPEFRRADPEDRYVKGGFVERKLTCHRPGPKSTERWKPEPYQIKKFRESLEFVKSSGCDILLVYAPVSRTFYEGYTNQDSLAAVLTKGYTYIDCNKQIALNDSLHFYDGHHLNTNGVREFSKMMIPLVRGRLNNAIDLK